MRFPLIALAAVAVLLTAASSASAAGAYNDYDCKPTRSKPPVVLVHGTFANGQLNWSYMGPRLAARGWCTFAFDYGVRNGVGATDDIRTSAKQLATIVTRVRRAAAGGQGEL